MLKWALVFFLLTLASLIVAYSGAGGQVAGIAKFLAIAFIIAFGAALLVHLKRRPRA